MRRLRHVRSGFTLIEIMISIAILGVMGVAFTSSMRSMANLTHAGNARSNVQRDGARALESVLHDLRRSGVVNVAGLQYPYLFENGDAEPDFDPHDHAVPPGAAVEGDYDWAGGTTREIVLVLPADADLDRVPDVDPDGELLWSPDEISYVLGTDVRGAQVLERRVNAASPRTIATSVERVVFDDAASSGFVIPNDAVRVRIYFRATDEVNREVRYFVEGMARLRNGDL
jgi:prepilin-type N-terminal cleavage/methylation domain-containing protein